MNNRGKQFEERETARAREREREREEREREREERERGERIEEQVECAHAHKRETRESKREKRERDFITYRDRSGWCSVGKDGADVSLANDRLPRAHPLARPSSQVKKKIHEISRNMRTDVVVCSAMRTDICNNM